ncbi:MAG: SPFH domain-containing protein [Christensenellales bacterium]
MGFFGKQMLKVIEWSDQTQDTLVHRYDIEATRKEVMKGSQLTVRPSQAVIFVNEGKVADIFREGRYVLDTNNLPILTHLMSWKYAFETPFKSDIYFVNMRQFTAQKWGTTNPIMMRDKEFGMIRLRGYGVYSFRVKDPEKLMYEVFATMHTFKTGDITEQLKKIIVSGLSDAIAESKIAALDLAMNYLELSEYAVKILQKRFNDLGFELLNLDIENLSLPEEVEKIMDKRTSMGVLGDQMGTYTQFQAAEAMRDAARNTGGGAVGAGVGMGAGIGIGGMMAQTLSQSLNNAKQNTAPASESTVKCPKCGASVRENAKFCPECGEKLGSKVCPNCGATVKASAKFCPECGQKIGEKKKCSECGAEVKAGAKFCPECGNKIE